MRLKDQVVVLTGASSGVGRAAAPMLAAEGAKLVLAARRGERLKALARKIEEDDGEACAVPTDVVDYGQTTSLMKQALERFGKIDILVNNAGMNIAKPFQDISLDEMRTVVDVNLWGVIHCTHGVLPHMIERAEGKIINVLSIASIRSFPSAAVYCAAKYGALGFCQSLAHDVHRYNIQVTAIHPGRIATEFWPDGPPPKDNLTAEEVAECIVFAAVQPASAHIRELLIMPPSEMY